MKSTNKKGVALALIGSSLTILSVNILRNRESSSPITPWFIAGLIGGIALVFVSAWWYRKRNRACK